MTSSDFPRETLDALQLVDRLKQTTDWPGKIGLWDSASVSLTDWPADEEGCKALLDVADALRFSGRYKDSRLTATRALAIAYELCSEELIALAQVLLGSVEMHVGEMHKANAAFVDALAAARRCRDHAGTCRALLWLSYVEQSTGHLSIAIHHAQECLDLALEQRLDSWVTAARRYIGLHSTLSGKLCKAMEALAAACASLATEGSDLERGRALLSLGYVEALAGRLSDADRHLTEARAVISRNDSKKDLAVCSEYEAALYLNQGLLDRAEQAIKECMRISLEEFPDGDMTSQGYRLWAEIDIRRDSFKQAREHAQDALGVARRVGERIEIGAIERILGQCDDAEGQEEAARRHFAEAVGILSDCGARYELALSHLAAGRATCHARAERLSHLHTALALFHEMEVAHWAQQTEDVIRSLTSPTVPKSTRSASKIRVITRTKSMRDLLAGIDRVKDYDDIILLEGETGVGKDLLAKYAHETGNRADRPFVPFNAAAVPEALAESELFGHVRGSFSGAMRDREGLLFAARNGTFFFNEISEAPPTFQAKLLSVIETRRARPVGSNVEKAIQARLIFATNRNLEAEVRSGRFRKDLFYRLTTARFVIPPLRDRARDIDPLLVHFLTVQELSHDQIEDLRQAPEWSAMANLPWEGNVRELEMLSRRLGREVNHDPQVAPHQVLNRMLHSSLGLGHVSRESLDRMRIAAMLKKHRGNKRQAAAELGMPESTLRWKIKHLGVEFRP